MLLSNALNRFMADIRVSIVQASAPRSVEEWQCVLPLGATVLDALRASPWASQLGAAGADQPVGVWGRRVALSDRLRDHDRVEIYRALTVDPKLARRQRFAQQGSRASGLFAGKRPGAKAGY